MTAPIAEVWIVEDNAAFGSTVARVLESTPGFAAPRVFRSCESALAQLGPARRKPDVVLMDVGLPGMSGLDGVRAFRIASPQTRVLILTVFEDYEKVVAAICAGASGYLLKSGQSEKLIEAIREVLDGGAPINARIARQVLETFGRMMRPGSRDYGLTDREREILQMIVQGQLKKEIAGNLGISFHTVDTHLRHIYGKLEVNSRSSAVTKALQEKLV